MEEKTGFRFGSAISDRSTIKEGALMFISKVVNRYKDEDVIIAWQVENEPLSRAGPRELWIRKDFLQEEIFQVKKTDDKERTVVVSAMTYPNGFLRFLSRLTNKNDPILETIDIAPVPALDVYPAIGHRVVGAKVCFLTDRRTRVAYLKKFIDRARSQGKSLWITELQAEPWEPGELVHTREEKAVTCGAENFLATFEELRALGAETIFLWGVEYWLYRKRQYQDNTWVDAYNQIVTEHRRKKKGSPRT